MVPSRTVNIRYMMDVTQSDDFAKMHEYHATIVTATQYGCCRILLFVFLCLFGVLSYFRVVKEKVS